MYPFVNILGVTISSYGLAIAAGVIISNVIAYFIIKKIKLDYTNFIILEAYAFIGAMLGSKILFLINARNQIEWNKFFEFEYFNYLMRTGFVFYGGLILAIALVFVAGKIHKISALEYLQKCIFVIPLMHAFGRVGCFLAGCCYGIPYNGLFSVEYSQGSLAPTDVHLFPVQPLEAILLLGLGIILIVLTLKGNTKYNIEIYVISYSVVRFCLEFLRFDEIRGIYYELSTSQWISILLLIVGIILIIYKKRKEGNDCGSK